VHNYHHCAETATGDYRHCRQQRGQPFTALLPSAKQNKKYCGNIALAK
jgi:hypothetical protein